MDFDDEEFRRKISEQIAKMSREEKARLARVIVEHVNKIAKPIISVIENHREAQVLMMDPDPTTEALMETQVAIIKACYKS